MKHTGLMKAMLGMGIKLHKSRLECLSMMMLGIVEARTVNLKTVVGKIQSWSQEDSVYRRAQRFFSEIELDGLLFTRLMVKLIGKERYKLCIDRTNWKLGNFNINILMLAVADDGLAIPLAFVLLNKTGNSNTLERTTLIEQVLKVINAEQIEVLLADREFMGQAWFKFLIEHKIPFAIRIRENSLADDWYRLSHFFTSLAIAETRTLKQRYKLCGCPLGVAATKSQDEKLVIVVTNRNPAWALKLYAMRWQIESLFKALKSSGFNLEDTHITDINKLNTLVAVVSLAFLWALKVGNYLHLKNPIRLKAHGRREKSVFKLGLDFIHRAITNLSFNKCLLDDAFRVLSCT